jgi:putative SOS response-associated peptidase YedK
MLSSPRSRVDRGQFDRQAVLMCNLYSLTKGPSAIRDLLRVVHDRTGNLPPLPGTFHDYPAPIVRVANGEREIAMARWGMPSPQFALKGKTTDPGVTNVRNVSSPHWWRWFLEEGRIRF